MSRDTATRPRPQVTCPNCGAAVEWHNASRWKPFCSERCRLVDLGEWINEEKAIPGEPADVPPDAGSEYDDS